jgi:hypothetical protein
VTRRRSRLWRLWEEPGVLKGAAFARKSLVVSKEPKSQKEPQKPDGNGAAEKQSPEIAKIDDAYSDGFDYLLINGDMSERMFAAVMKTVPPNRKNKKLLLILITYGGLANPTYRTARLLQSFYDEVHAFIPSYCKSAGTLLICSAHTLILSPFGEIGPLDVQLIQKDEIFGRRSGLTTRSALLDLKAHAFDLFEHFMFEIVGASQGAASFRLASDISARATSNLMSKIYEQINPDALGQDFRDLNVAAKYGERLNMKHHNLKNDGIKRLVYEYPSHDFVIDLEEAREIFDRAVLPTATLFKILTSRTGDMMLPKTGARVLVEMLTSEGQPLSGGQANVTKAGTQNANASAANSRSPKNGDGSGKGGEKGGPPAV